MDGERVLDVDGNEVVVTSLCSGVLRCRKLGRLLGKACGIVSHCIKILEEDSYKVQQRCRPSSQ
jgi:hypothetical protein